MPISFSAWCIISLVMRSGVGDGRGEGEAAGVGVWANVVNGDFETASPAAPAAGSSFTKLRRLIEVRFVFFIALERGHSARIYYLRCPRTGQPTPPSRCFMGVRGSVF